MNPPGSVSGVKTILFDIGGVLVTSFGKGFIEYASRILGIEGETLRRLVSETEAQLQKGEIDAHPNKQHIEFWYSVLEKAKEENIIPTKDIPDRRELAQLWVKPYLENVKPIPEMIQLIRDLKESGNVRLGTLSNIQEPHTLLLRKMLGKEFDELFDFHVLSNEVHARKPDPEVYRMALEKADCQNPEEVLFIDDSRVNIDGAEKAGIKVFLQPEGDIESTKKTLRDHGVSWTDTGTEPRTEMDLSIS